MPEWTDIGEDSLATPGLFNRRFDSVRKGAYHDVKSYGAEGDGSTDDWSAISSAASAAKDGGIVFFPSADYAIDNSEGFRQLNNFDGSLVFAPGARLVFQSRFTGGLKIQNGTRTRISGLNIAYSNSADSRVNAQEALFLSDLTDASLDHINIDGSAAAGIVCQECIRLKLTDIHVQNTQADGVLLRNCEHWLVKGLSTDSTGDDGFSAQNNSSYRDLNGGVGTGIIVRKSASRGISVVGQSDVLISDFYVDRTKQQGILVTRDSGFEYPDNVVMKNGLILQGGAYLSGANNGMAISNTPQTFYEGIRLLESGSNGFQVDSSVTNIKIQDIFVQDARNIGINIQGQGNVWATSCIVDGSGNRGFAVNSVPYANVRDITVEDSSTSNTLNRAFDFTANEWLHADGLTIRDSQASATGVKLGVYNSAQSGTIRNVQHFVENGTFQIDNTSSVSVEGEQTYSVSNLSKDRTYDADSSSTLELGDVLGTLISDLQDLGILS